MLSEWINPKYLNKDEIEKIKSDFKVAKPFPNMILTDFFLKDKLSEIKDCLKNIEYYEENHDLYQFLRTINFKHIDDKIITKFAKFVGSVEFVCFIEDLTGLKFSKEVFELHSLNFKNTHYLLCHDDQVQERKVAFIIYLCDEFKSGDGGELELFESENNVPTKITKSILPKFNQFALFEVTDKSFHQVSEVLVDKDRISIGAWFYSEK